MIFDRFCYKIIGEISGEIMFEISNGILGESPDENYLILKE